MHTGNINGYSLYPFQSPRGDFGFLKRVHPVASGRTGTAQFQSPRGDFGFLKARDGGDAARAGQGVLVSIPSRGFWFFEERTHRRHGHAGADRFQSPRGDFGFLKL